MNPNCFGTGDQNVPGCQCKVLFDLLQYCIWNKKLVLDIVGNVKMNVEATLAERWEK